MNPVSSLGATPAATLPVNRKLRRAAQEFEGELLACLLKPLEQAFSGLSGPEATAGSEQYGSMGIEALAGALSHSGGIGIAELVLRQIGRTKGMGESGPGAVDRMRAVDVSD